MKKIKHVFTETGEVRRPDIKDGIGEWFWHTLTCSPVK